MTTALEANPHRRSSLELPDLLSLTKQKSRVLGSGAHGVVKSVRLNADQGLVAVKTLRAHASTSEMECFAREKEILRKLCHECVLYPHMCMHAVHTFSDNTGSAVTRSACLRSEATDTCLHTQVYCWI